MTLKVRKGLPSLRSARIVRELERSFARAAERGEFRLAHYTIQGDHVHLIVEAKDRAALGRGMKAVGARFARAVNRVFGTTGRVLADVYHLRILKTPREVRNALAYVLLNARRHAAKWRGREAPGPGRIDFASSGRWFDGWRAPVPSADAAGRAPPVATPHTWLLRTGWRRHGRIDPNEIPG